MSKTDDAFDRFRAAFSAKACNRALVRNDDELRLMTSEDGLLLWKDGPGVPAVVPEVPLVDQSDERLQLWVVRKTDTPYASERSTFADSLETKKIKHSNLTGGEGAHCGGELVKLEEGVIALSGSSGRYGPTSTREMDAVAQAFRASGYGVWSYGYDEETNKPFNFYTGKPRWVE